MFMFSNLNTTENIHFYHIISAELELKTKKNFALLYYNQYYSWKRTLVSWFSSFLCTFKHIYMCQHISQAFWCFIISVCGWFVSSSSLKCKFPSQFSYVKVKNAVMKYLPHVFFPGFPKQKSKTRYFSLNIYNIKKKLQQINNNQLLNKHREIQGPLSLDISQYPWRINCNVCSDKNLLGATSIATKGITTGWSWTQHLLFAAHCVLLGLCNLLWLRWKWGHGSQTELCFQNQA